MFHSLTRIAIVSLALASAQPTWSEDLPQDACQSGSLECTRVLENETVEINMHEECRLVTNRNAFPLMVAHKSDIEWSVGDYAFLTNPPPNTVIDICATWPTPEVLSFYANPFVDLTNVPRSTLVVSNIVTVVGFEGTVPVAVSATAESMLRIRSNDVWGPWTTQGEMKPGDGLQLRHRSSGSNLGIVQTDVSIGGWSDDWLSTANQFMSTCASGSVGGFSNDRGMFPGDTIGISLFDGTGVTSFDRQVNQALPSTCVPSTPVPVWLEYFASTPVTNTQGPYAPATETAEFVGLSVNGSDPQPAVYWKRGDDLQMVVKNANGNVQMNFVVRVNGNASRSMSRRTTQVVIAGSSLANVVEDRKYLNVNQSYLTETVTLQRIDITERDAYAGIGMQSLDPAYWPLQGASSYSIFLAANYESTRKCSVRVGRTTLPITCESMNLQVQRGLSTTWQTIAANTATTVSAGDRVRIRYTTGFQSAGGSRSMIGRILAGTTQIPVLTANVNWETLPTTFPASNVEPGATVTSSDMPVAQVTGSGCVMPQVSAGHPLSNPRMIVNGVDRGFLANICNGDTLAIRVSAAAGSSGTQQVSISGGTSGWTAKTWPVTIKKPIVGGSFSDTVIGMGSYGSSDEITVSNLPPNTSVPVTVTGSSALGMMYLYAQGVYRGYVWSGNNTFNVITDGLGNLRISYFAQRGYSSTAPITVPFTLGGTYDDFSRTWTIR